MTGATSVEDEVTTPGIVPVRVEAEDAGDLAAAVRVRAHASSALAPGATAEHRAAAAATRIAIASVIATVAPVPRPRRERPATVRAAVIAANPPSDRYRRRTPGVALERPGRRPDRAPGRTVAMEETHITIK